MDRVLSRVQDERSNTGQGYTTFVPDSDLMETAMTEPDSSMAYDPAREYTVEGMTCSHCVASVREEVSEVAGVSSVDVDLVSGRMVVSGENISDDEVRNAVEEAGYELATAP